MSLGICQGLGLIHTAADLLVQMARDSGQPVISEFSLYAFALKLFRDRGYAGSPLPPRNNALTERRARKLLFQATSNEGFTSFEPATNRLPRDPDFSSVLFILAPAETIEVMMDLLWKSGEFP